MRIRSGTTGLPDQVDLVVVGLGATGAGVALDAVSRGLTVIAVDAHDLAFGTSRWSSKLVHGGLRYLAQGHVAIAHESAVERRILMESTAPHLTHALPMLFPLHTSVTRGQAAATRTALAAGDVLRMGARTARETLPRPRKVSATEALSLAPCLRVDGLRGGLLGWDGQLEDDARLVVNIARTAASYGAHVRTRARVLAAAGDGVRLRDETTGSETEVSARMVVNAAGVWASGLADVPLRPSRGSHLVLRGESLPGLRVCVTAPVPRSTSRFVMALPQPDGTVYVGLTDEPVDGPVPDVPQPSEPEVDFLLDVVSTALARPLTREDVVGSFAGLRPLLDTGQGETADLSRSHAVLTSRDGIVTVVGGKLTTYRRMAQDAVDAALVAAGLEPRPCPTRRLPLLGAADRKTLAGLVARGDADPRLVRRFGTDADLVLHSAREATGLPDRELLAPAAPEVPVTLAELVFGVTHEGATDLDDLLDRRTRVGLVPSHRTLVEPLARRALSTALAG
jgi:glycerol-3-phosphate dehydrogenase